MDDANAELIRVLLEENAANPRVLAALEAIAGEPVFLESKNGKKAISWEWLLKLLPKIMPFLPLILSFLIPGGGLSGPLIEALIKAIAQAFGVSLITAEAMLSQVLEQRALSRMEGAQPA